MRERLVIVGSYDWQRLFAAFRLVLFICLPLFIAIQGSILLDGADPLAAAGDIIQFFPLLRLIKWPIIAICAIWLSLRYLIVPVAATLGILLAAAMFVKDIYNINHTRDAFRYVIASMFGFEYPTLTIDKGEKQLTKNKVNLIDKIGGPGKVMIEPGNAAMFRNLHSPSDVNITTTYFLPPFDTVAQAVNLEEQQADKDEINAMTRDGIKVIIRDIHFRYRIRFLQGPNKLPVRPTMETPYPISPNAMENVAFNLSVERNGLDKWNTAVERVVIGAITDFVAGNYIDFLTAPREGKRNPRIEIRNELFYRGVQRALEGLGAELLWADVGHVDVDDPRVDDSRNDMWAAEWIDDANAIRAFGEAKRAAYHELGRAEAQAELIMSITDVVSQSIQDSGGNVDIRKILLARTAQVLDAMTERNKSSGQS